MRDRRHRRSRWTFGAASASVLLVLGAAWASACSSSEAHSYGPPGADAGAGDDAGNGGIVDAQCERADTGLCAPPPWCTEDAGHYCIGDCFQTWPTDAGSICAMYPLGSGLSPVVEECGSYHLLEVVSGDGNVSGGTTYYYYDKTTGELVAVVHSTGSTDVCLAGPPGFTPPHDCGHVGTPLACSLPDAGT